MEPIRVAAFAAAISRWRFPQQPSTDCQPFAPHLPLDATAQRHKLWFMPVLLSLAMALNGVGTIMANAAAIQRRILYTQVTGFAQDPGIGQMALSANGSTIVFSTNDKKVFTVRADGTALTQVFDYASHRGGCPCLAPWVDIDATGATILWTDTVGEIFVSRSDGSDRRRLATLFKGPNIATSGPVIRVPPRLTADGRRVIFAASLPDAGRIPLGWQDYAGIWTASADGSEMTQLLSYAQLSRQVLGKDGTEYNPNVAFFPGFDISDDGSRVIFSTSQDSGAVVALEGGVPRTLAATTVVGPQALAISGAGATVAYVPQTPSFHEWVAAGPFQGAPAKVLAEIGVSGTLQLTRDGTQFLASSSGTAVPLLPIGLHDVGSSLRWDIVVLSCFAPASDNPFAAARLPSMSSDGRRMAFVSDLAIPQIWIADLDPASTFPGPTISGIDLAPSYLLMDAGSSAMMTANIQAGTSPVTRVCLDTLRDGVASSSLLSNTQLFDDGTNGDIQSGDGRYTQHRLRRAFGTPGNVTLRVSAFAGRYIASADVEPFSIRTSVPLAPTSEIHRAVEIRWRTELGVRYQVLRGWEPDGPVRPWGEPVVGTGDFMSVFDQTREAEKAFYRVQVAE